MNKTTLTSVLQEVPSDTVSDASVRIFTYAVTYPSEVAISNLCGLPQRHLHETH